MKRSFAKLALASVALSAFAPGAFAQENPFERNRYVSVTERPQPEFDQQPLRAGAFRLTPSLGLGAEYTDNVYAQNQGEEDTILVVRPELDVQSDWSRHALGASFTAEARQFLEQDSENTEAYQGVVRGRLDVVRDFWIGGQALAGRQVEMRFAPAAVSRAAEPVEYDVFGLNLDSQLRGGRTQLDVGLGLFESDYEDVPVIPDNNPATSDAPLEQDFRDVTETWVRARGSYAVSPDVAVFVQSRYATLDYDLAALSPNPSGPPTVLDRDATRWSAQIGASFELQRPFRGDIALGFFNEDKESPVFRDFDGFSIEGRLQWFPTQLTTVTTSASRGAYDPGLFNSASATQTIVGVRADHELRRNVLVFADTRYVLTDFQDIDREDNQFDISLGVGYKLNPNARIEAGFTRRTIESSGFDAELSSDGRARDLDQNILGVTLRLFP
jgi:hypothetical protein